MIIIAVVIPSISWMSAPAETFTQMLEQKTEDGRFAEVSIYDYPSIKLRGYVEGFYGYPWSFEDRLGLFSDTSKFKMNTYNVAIESSTSSLSWYAIPCASSNSVIFPVVASFCSP